MIYNESEHVMTMRCGEYEIRIIIESQGPKQTTQKKFHKAAKSLLRSLMKDFGDKISRTEEVSTSRPPPRDPTFRGMTLDEISRLPVTR